MGGQALYELRIVDTFRIIACMQVFELLAQCMHESPERRPRAAEAAQRLQHILTCGDFVCGKWVASKPLKVQPGSMNKVSSAPYHRKLSYQLGVLFWCYKSLFRVL